MFALRALILRYRALAVAVLALALAMKAVVPAGMMIDGDSARTVTVRLCDGITDSARSLALPVKHDSAKPMHDQQACPFSALGLHALGGADPIVLALALLVVFALAFAALPVPTLRINQRLRPPPHAPPVFA